MKKMTNTLKVHPSATVGPAFFLMFIALVVDLPWFYGAASLVTIGLIVVGNMRLYRLWRHCIAGRNPGGDTQFLAGCALLAVAIVTLGVILARVSMLCFTNGILAAGSADNLANCTLIVMSAFFVVMLVTNPLRKRCALPA